MKTVIFSRAYLTGRAWRKKRYRSEFGGRRRKAESYRVPAGGHRINILELPQVVAQQYNSVRYLRASHQNYADRAAVNDERPRSPAHHGSGRMSVIVATVPLRRL